MKPRRSARRRPSRAGLRAAFAFAAILTMPAVPFAGDETLEGKKGQFDGYISAAGPFHAIEYADGAKAAVARHGRFVAGTGRLAGIAGDYTFQWTDWTSGDTEGTVKGHADTVKGRYRLP